MSDTTPRNLSSELAREAFKCAKRAQFEEKYPQYVKKMPAMIRNSGFVKAFAFGYSKDEKLYEWIYSDIRGWLAEQNLLDKKEEDSEKIEKYKNLKQLEAKEKKLKRQKLELEKEDKEKLESLKKDECLKKAEELQHRMIEDMLKKFIDMDYSKYRRCENETMAFLDWLRRFAEGMSEDDDAPEEKGGQEAGQ